MLWVLFVGLSWALPIRFDEAEYCTLLQQMANTPGYLDPPSTVANAHAMVTKGLISIMPDLFESWNISSAVVKQLLVLATEYAANCEDNQTAGFPFHPFLPCMDGVVAAPASHTIAFSNELVQVIFWHLCAGCQEPYHTHVLASLTFDVFPGELVFVSFVFFKKHSFSKLVSSTTMQRGAFRTRRLPSATTGRRCRCESNLRLPNGCTRFETLTATPIE